MFVFVLSLEAAAHAATTQAAQQRPDPPYTKTGLLEALRMEALSAEELVEEVMKRGVDFELTHDDERDIRLAGKYLKRHDADLLIKAVNLNYRPEYTDKRLTMPLGVPARIGYLDFAATYAGKTADGYLLKIKHPGKREFELETNAGCEHVLSWGGRDYTLRLTAASPQSLEAVLVDEVKPAVNPDVREDNLTPRKIEVRVSPCVAFSMWLVSGNYTGGDRPSDPFYISEPLTIGLLRHYAEHHPSVMTSIPPNAKDDELIREIHRDDARGIARMLNDELHLNTNLPSASQWRSALRAGVLKPGANAELVAEGDGLLVIKVDDSNQDDASPDSTPITTSGYTTGAAQGYFRIVRPAGPEPKHIAVPKTKRYRN